MGRLIRSNPGRPSADKRKSARRSPVSAKDSLLADQEFQLTRSQLQIEQLQRTIEALKNSDERLRAVYQNSPVGYLTLDEKGLIIEWNPKAADLLGGQARGFAREPFLFFVAREHTEMFLHHLRECKRSKRYQGSHREQVVSELNLKKGKERIAVQIVSIPFQNGDQTFFHTALIDLTERKKSKRATEEARKLAETIIQTIHEPLLVVDANLKILRINEAFAKLFQMPTLLAKGLSLGSLLGFRQNEGNPRARLLEVLQKNIPLNNFEFEDRSDKMKRQVFVLNARRLPQKEGDPPALLIALEDITARKDAEESLALSNEKLQTLNDGLEKRVEDRTRELRSSNKQLESFCYTIAHDLRAPLRAMAGFSTIVLDDFASQLGPRGITYVEKIVAGGQQMDRLIRDLLEYGRFTTVDFERKTVDADEVLNQVIDTLQPVIAEKHARIERKGKLPRISGHQVVLEAAFSNLISNALKFVRPQTPPQVTIWPEEKDKQIRIWIEDNGIGIEPRYHQRIFDVFQRLHSQEAYPGTGIGLAIVQRAMQRIGGNVGVESAPGKGSRFWICLASAA